MTVHDVLIPVAILLVALVILAVVLRIRADVADRDAIDTDQLSAAIGTTWRDLDFDETVGRLETHAAQLREFHGDISRMLRTPRERGEFGEHQLDVILSDHLPPDLYGIRTQVVGGKTPDAHVDSSAGLVCIDSKFPLENYERALEAESDAETQRFEAAFRDDVEAQLEKIATDYVAPADGTAPFAFAFVPSESVYYHLISAEYDLLRDYTKRGVQVVSPLTLGHKLELIRADVHARQLSEQAEDVLEQLTQLGAKFEALQDDWETLFRHLENAKNKADEVDRDYERLRSEFERIDHPDLEE